MKNELNQASGSDFPMGFITNPMSPNGTKQHICAVLRLLASGENCDGEPYDQMMQASNYIEYLESGQDMVNVYRTGMEHGAREQIKVMND